MNFSVEIPIKENKSIFICFNTRAEMDFYVHEEYQKTKHVRAKYMAAGKADYKKYKQELQEARLIVAKELGYRPKRRGSNEWWFTPSALEKEVA